MVIPKACKGEIPCPTINLYLLDAIFPINKTSFIVELSSIKIVLLDFLIPFCKYNIYPILFSPFEVISFRTEFYY